MTDLVNLALSAIRAHKLRSFLSTLGIAIGVGSVVLLTSIGEGTRHFMLEQFTQFGTNLIAIHPGKTETVGIPGILGGTTNPLTLEDALAVALGFGLIFGTLPARRATRLDPIEALKKA